MPVRPARSATSAREPLRWRESPSTARSPCPTAREAWPFPAPSPRARVRWQLPTAAEPSRSAASLAGPHFSVGGTGTTSLSGTNSYTGDACQWGYAGHYRRWNDSEFQQLDDRSQRHTRLEPRHRLSDYDQHRHDYRRGDHHRQRRLRRDAGPGAGNTIGTLAVNGNLSITGGTLATTLSGTSTSPGGATNDLIDVNGNLTLSGADRS